MKKQLFIITTTLLTSAALCQDIQLWGTTAEGGNTNTGTVFQFTVSDNTVTSASCVHSTVYETELNGLVQATNGKLYGISRKGQKPTIESNSIVNPGVIFEIDASTGEYKEVYQFPNGQTELGIHPFGNLLAASNGKLYGTTRMGGTNSSGVIFEYDPLSDTYTKLFDFDATSGTNPEGTLVEGSNGVLYGTTRYGGQSGFGTFFKFTLATSNFAVIVNFQSNQGTNPINSLIKIDNSTIIGSTPNGGLNDRGVIFKYDFVLDDFQIVYHLGIHPNLYGSISSLAFDGVNKVYGTSSPADTLVPSKLFCYNLSSDTVTILHTFNPLTDGHQPIGGVTILNGKLYGFNSMGGANYHGAFYKYDISGDLFSVIEYSGVGSQSFKRNRTTPFVASNNMIYLMGSSGSIFMTSVPVVGGVTKYDPIANSFGKVIDFNNSVTGSVPTGTLYQTSNGKLFGSAKYGGTNSSGTLFEIDRFNWDLQTVVNAPSIAGANFIGNLIEEQGKLYTVSSSGSIVVIDPLIPQISATGTVGNSPNNGLTKAGSSAYGVTSVGGNNSLGTIYRFNFSTNATAEEFSFDGALYGSNPVGQLLYVDDNYLFGMTNTGGVNGLGVIYKYDPFIDDFTKLYDFDGSNGSIPRGSLIKHSNGKLYGMTYMGGDTDLGVLFSYDYTTDVYTKLIEFDSINGSFPEGTLFEASNGLIYGMTSKGGVNNDGVIFSFNPTTLQLTKLFDFDRKVSGSRPVASFIEVDMELSTDQLTKSVEYVIYPNPAHDQVTIKGTGSAKTQVTITDLSGKQILQQTIGASAVIDVSALPKGMYVLTLTSDFGQQTQKLVKH